MKKLLGLALMGLGMTTAAQAATLECWVQHCTNDGCEDAQSKSTAQILGEGNAGLYYTIGQTMLYSVSLKEGYMQMRMRHPEEGFYATASMERFEKHAMVTLESNTGAEYEFHCVKK